ncbi:MAG: 50S ribosomal protein L35 [Candidatus Doudnabacteria bacterium]|nr:50S ribosomal protein L35 [Candidatus Doudnabacteria bacterium]
MPKLKTHKGTAKRIWRTGGGKLRRRHAHRSHHRGRAGTTQLFRRLRDNRLPEANPRLQELIPYK